MSCPRSRAARPRASAASRHRTSDISGSCLMTRRTDLDGTIHDYCHDAAGRLVGEETRVGSTTTRSITYDYDAVGNRLRRQASGGTAMVASTWNMPTHRPSYTGLRSKLRSR